jgi:pimeloyl-ACP methyl ester carboxylesterase
MMTNSSAVKFPIQIFARVVGRITLILLCILIAGTLILFGVLFVMSPGKPKPFLDKSGKVIANSISEKIYVNINGVKQGMFIEGKNKNNPVILFLHGGPGMPEYFLAEKYRTGLEDNFTVCYWEQRGSGLSYSKNMFSNSETTEQLIADTLTVTNYLRNRFGQQKIYLMGHSWGTYLGIQVAARAPQL